MPLRTRSDSAVRREAANAIRDRLAALVAELALAISVLPSRRDGARILALWDEIGQNRIPLVRELRLLHRMGRKPANALGRDGIKEQRERLALIRTIRAELRLWPVMDSMVRRHATPMSQPLIAIPAENERDPILTILHKALHALANTSAQSAAADAHGCFPDIPMGIQAFEELMSAAYRLRLVMGPMTGLRFIDVGCGGGTTILAASRFFPHCDGLEYDPAYVEAAERNLGIFGLPGSRVIHHDALTWDGYGDYDVIYFYRPLKDDEKLAALERRIVGQARPGTIVLAPYNSHLEVREGIACTNVTGCVLVAGMSQDEADGLRREAERTGRGVIRRKGDYPMNPGIWVPAIEAATINGRR